MPISRGFRNAILPIFIAISLTGLTACTQQDRTAELNMRIGQLEDENRSLREQIDALKKQLDEQQASGGATGATGQSTSGGTPASATASGAAPSGSTAPFPDVSGIFGSKDIQALRSEGVLDVDGVNFEPAKPVTRAEFVRWLMKKHNAPLPPAAAIHPAGPKTKPAFSDVPATDPNFGYIEGMHDAGWSIGFADKTFHPTSALTREQLLAIKAPGDKEFMPAATLDRLLKWNDSGEPQKPVTRAEAAICLANLGSESSEAPTQGK